MVSGAGPLGRKVTHRCFFKKKKRTRVVEINTEGPSLYGVPRRTSRLWHVENPVFEFNLRDGALQPVWGDKGRDYSEDLDI